MVKLIFVLFLISTCVVVNASFWSGCTNSQGVAPDSVTSDACSESLCNGQRGSSLLAHVLFTPRQNHNDLEVRVFATVLGITIRLPGEYPYDNACNSIYINGQQQRCPVSANTQYNWIIDMEIPLSLPALNARIRYEIWDGTIEVMCATINAVLT